MKIKIAFLDHYFHEKTKSSDFFIDILKNIANVDSFYFDPALSSVRNLVPSMYDIIIFWQVIPEASCLSKMNHNNILLIPMYDACKSWTHAKWYKYRCFRFICFSKALYTILGDIGIDAFYIRYVPFLDKLIHHDTSDLLTAFVWRRTDKMNINVLLRSLKLIGVEKVILHDILDSNLEAASNIDNSIDLSVEKTLGWFETHADYLEVVSKCNVFVAPREYEGIGMGFLEAMGMGLCVVSPNTGTMNEYITHNVNGILFKNFRSLSENKNLDYKLLQINARKSYELFYEEWNFRQGELLNYIQSSVKKKYQFKSFRYFLFSDIKIVFEKRIFPYIKRNMSLNDY